MRETRKKVHYVINSGFNGNWSSKTFDVVMTLMIFINLTLIFEFSGYGIADESHILMLGEWFIMLFFLIEYLMRVWTCVEDEYWKNSGKSNASIRFRHVLRFLSIIDLLAFLPFILFFFIHFSDIDVRILKTIQLIRILKLTRVFGYLRLITEVLTKNVASLTGALIVMLNLMLVAALGIYFFEKDLQPETFGTIGKAAWWSLITLTTVGYGDAVPQSQGGKAFTFVLVLISMGIIGIPISIVTTSLQELIEKKRNMRAFVRRLFAEGETENQYKQILKHAEAIELSPVSAAEVYRFERDKAKSKKMDDTQQTKHASTGGSIQCPHCLREIRLSGKGD